MLVPSERVPIRAPRSRLRTYSLSETREVWSKVSRSAAALLPFKAAASETAPEIKPQTYNGRFGEEETLLSGSRVGITSREPWPVGYLTDDQGSLPPTKLGNNTEHTHAATARCDYPRVVDFKSFKNTLKEQAFLKLCNS